MSYWWLLAQQVLKWEQMRDHQSWKLLSFKLNYSPMFRRELYGVLVIHAGFGNCERESGHLSFVINLSWFDLHHWAEQRGGKRWFYLKMSKQMSWELCPKTFTSRSGLSNHKQVHSGVKKYKCAQCNKSFGRDEHLKKHSLIHTGEKPHKCRHCNYSCSV